MGATNWHHFLPVLLVHLIVIPMTTLFIASLSVNFTDKFLKYLTIYWNSVKNYCGGSLPSFWFSFGELILLLPQHSLVAYYCSIYFTPFRPSNSDLTSAK
jgi:hypothetical protein